MDYLLNFPVYFIENRERKNIYFVPKWTKPMAACSPKSHRTFRILFTLLHTIKTACKVFTLLCCNLKNSKKKKTVTQRALLAGLKKEWKEGRKLKLLELLQEDFSFENLLHVEHSWMFQYLWVCCHSLEHFLVKHQRFSIFSFPYKSALEDTFRWCGQQHL